MNVWMRRLTTGWLVSISILGTACADLELEPHPELTELRLSPDNQLILSGDTLKLIATAYDAEGEKVSIPSWTPIHWSVNDKSIEIMSDGRIVGHRGSDALVTAHAAGLTGGTRIRINPRALGVTVTVVISQAAQDLEGSIPLISGRDAILRAFVTTQEINYYESVDLQATLRLNSGQTWQTPVLTTRSDSVEKEVVDDFGRSYLHDVAIPGSLIQPGAELTVELDPRGELPPGLSLVPNPVRTRLSVVQVPIHKQMVVPTIATGGGSDGRIRDWVRGLDSESHHFSVLRTMHPIYEQEVALHQVFRTDANLRTLDGWIEWIEAIEAMRIAEGRQGWHYYAVFSRTYSRGIAGVGLTGGYSAAGITEPWVIAHEIGHNFDLDHTPCGGAPDADPSFPYIRGNIGRWGFDMLNGQVYPPRTVDVMGYCPPPRWISDYHFGKALRHRLGLSASPPAAEQSTVLVWGAVDEDGIELRPAFRVSTIPEVPTGMGDYALAAVGPGDEVLFETRFTPTSIADAERRRLFSFAIPVSGEISRIVVLGPEGRDEIGEGTEQPMAMQWQGDQLVGVYRDWYPYLSEFMVGSDVATRIVISDGVPR